MFDRLAMEPNLRLKTALDRAGCDPIFHDCGELTDRVVEATVGRMRLAQENRFSRCSRGAGRID